MKKLIIFLLCFAILGTGGFFGYKKYEKSQDDKKVVDVVPVNMMAESADMYDYSSDDMSGEIISANSQKIYVDSQKLIKKVCVKQGDTVKKGDTILEYDMTVVELELAQKENQVKLIEQKIKMANKEIEKYKKLQPSENAPQEPDEPDTPDIPDEPDEPIVPDVPDPEPEPTPEPVETVDVVKPAFVQASGTGEKTDPYIINCSTEAKVALAFMQRMASTKKYAELCVYDKDSNFLYKWCIDGTAINVKEAQNWCVSDGITIDEKTGLITLDTTAKFYGTFSFALPAGTQQADDTDSSDDIADDTDISGDDSDINSSDDGYDYTADDIDNTDTSDDNSGSLDYVYSKAELQQMITEKQNEIKDMQIELKNANLEYNNSKKQKSDGKVVANIDGVVKKISDPDQTQDTGDSTSDDNTDEDYTDEDVYSGDSGDSDAFAIIEGDGGVEVRCSVSELNLPKAEVGSYLNVMSWETGSSTSAEVTSVETEPSSYNAENWGDNPNNSTYYVHAKLDDSADFNVGDWVSVSFTSSGTDSSNSVYLPIHYVRQEGGNYYIMKADDNNRLVKQYVKAGQIMYGTNIEIKGGLKMSDRICFPYGTDVKEGVKTKDSTEVLYPDSY